MPENATGTPGLGGAPYAGLGDLIVAAGGPDTAFAPVVFSALDTGPALEAEPAFAARGAWVFSNAAAFRMEPDIPLLIPEVNPDHLGLVVRQHKSRGWKGAIVTNPNCTATVLAIALKPLDLAFGVEAVVMASMQAVSGAGARERRSAGGLRLVPDPQRGCGDAPRLSIGGGTDSSSARVPASPSPQPVAQPPGGKRPLPLLPPRSVQAHSPHLAGPPAFLEAGAALPLSELPARVRCQRR